MDPFIKHGNERGSENSMNTRSMNKAAVSGGEVVVKNLKRIVHGSSYVNKRIRSMGYDNLKPAVSRNKPFETVARFRQLKIRERWFFRVVKGRLFLFKNWFPMKFHANYYPLFWEISRNLRLDLYSWKC